MRGAVQIRAVALVSAACWLLSLALVVAVTEEKGDHIRSGWWMLKTGLAGVLAFQFGWFANPILWMILTWVLSRPQRSGGRWMSVAITLPLALFAVDAMFWHETYDNFGDKFQVLSFGPGYYLWFASLAAAAIALWLRPMAPTARG